MCVPYVPASDPKGSFSYQNVYQRYLECRKNKRNSINALRFEMNAEENLLQLERELKTKTYCPSRSILFATTKPKLREVFAADFRDRIVHHVLIDHMEKIWEPVFIHDSYACRENKGTHAAVKRLQGYLRKVTLNGNVKTYYLQLDVKDFFMSINKEILFDLVKKRLHDPDMLWLAKTIIFWDCTKSYTAKGSPGILKNIPSNKSLFGKNNERGLAIGNLTSQFFANVYLNELDQFVKHTLKAKYYLRYVDDFVILGQDAEELSMFLEKIDAFLAERLKLTLHPRRRKLLPVSSGIDFLGYIVRRDYILVRRRVVNNLKAKLKAIKGSSIIKHNEVKATVASYRGHFKLANTYRLQRKVFNQPWIQSILQ